MLTQYKHTTHDPVQPLIDDLHSSGRLRVWSLVITIFGDAVQPRGGTVATSDLLAITGRAGIEPGGLRTAMSRLLKEGWVESEKHGRNSYYRLSAEGIAEFVSATRLIYQMPGKSNRSETTVLIVAPSEADLQTKAFDFLTSNRAIEITGDLFLWTQATQPDQNTMRNLGCFETTTQTSRIPSWMKRKIATPDLASQYEALAQRLSTMQENLANASHLDPLSALLARILIIHQWRKLVLKSPRVPSNLLPDDWPANECAVRVKELYHYLLERSELYWHIPSGTQQPDEIGQRFG